MHSIWVNSLYGFSLHKETPRQNAAWFDHNWLQRPCHVVLLSSKLKERLESASFSQKDNNQL